MRVGLGLAGAALIRQSNRRRGRLTRARARARRLRAWFNPTNCGLTGAEALQAPFFKLTHEGASVNALGRRVESKGPAPSPGSLDPAASIASTALPPLDQAHSLASTQGLPDGRRSVEAVRTSWDMAPAGNRA